MWFPSNQATFTKSPSIEHGHSKKTCNKLRSSNTLFPGYVWRTTGLFLRLSKLVSGERS